MGDKLQSYGIRVLEQLEQLSRLAEDERSAEVPKEGWSVSQHIEHLVLAGEVIVGNIEASLSLPAEKWRTNGRMRPMGRMVMLMGRIPRGRAKSPQISTPGNATLDNLRVRLDGLRERMSALCKRTAEVGLCSHCTTHPILGDFRPKQWVRFLTIHQQHHLDIICEMRRSKGY
jgi:hypothetical protein